MSKINISSDFNVHYSAVFEKFKKPLPDNNNPQKMQMQTSLGMNVVRAYLNIGFYTFVIPIRIAWNADCGKWEVLENRVQKLFAFLINFMSIPFVIDHAYLCGQSTTTTEQEYESSTMSTTFTVSELFGFMKLAVFPLFTVTWFYTLFSLKTSVQGLLDILNEDCDFNRIRIQKFNYVSIFVLLFGFMLVGEIFGTRWMDVDNRVNWPGWLIEIITTTEEKNKIADVFLRFVSFTQSWCFHIYPIFFNFTFAVFLRNECMEFAGSLNNLKNVHKNYLKLKRVSYSINQISGLMLTVMAFGSIPFYATLIESFATRNVWYTLGDLYTALLFILQMVIGSDALTKVLNVREWIMASFPTNRGKDEHNYEMMILCSMLHNDISTSPVALKGLSLFTVSYSFIGYYFGQCLTFAIIALQSQPAPKAKV